MCLVDQVRAQLALADIWAMKAEEAAFRSGQVALAEEVLRWHNGHWSRKPAPDNKERSAQNRDAEGNHEALSDMDVSIAKALEHTEWAVIDSEERSTEWVAALGLQARLHTMAVRAHTCFGQLAEAEEHAERLQRCLRQLGQDAKPIVETLGLGELDAMRKAMALKGDSPGFAVILESFASDASESLSQHDR